VRSFIYLFLDPHYCTPNEETLYAMSPTGFPPHALRLKIGAPIIVLRNIDQKAGICNGTRARITHMYNNLLIATISSFVS